MSDIQDAVRIEMPYIDFLLLIEQALRNNIVVWKDEEYRDIAERITREIYDQNSKHIGN